MLHVRGRIFVVFVSQKAGGEETLLRVVQKVERIAKLVHTHFQPTKVSDLLLPQDEVEEVSAFASTGRETTEGRSKTRSKSDPKGRLKA